MAEIRAFRATRFIGEAAERARSLAPPSGTISSEERERLAASPTNIVHATLPPSDPDDRSKFVRYARASAQLSAWRRSGALAVDETPALYRSDRGGLFALVALADLPAGDPVPVRARDERLRLLEATRTYLEPVPITVGGALWAILPEVEGNELAEETEHRAVHDASAIARFGAAIERFVVGPDGAAAVEAARAFRAGLGERAGVVPEDYLLAELLPPGAEPSPSGLVLWSLGTFA